jgi:hypothetical protein
MTLKSVGRTDLRHVGVAARLGLCAAAACAVLLPPAARAAQSTATPAVQPALQQRTFNTPEEAVAALVSAAEQFDVAALKEILGPDGVDLVVSDDPVLDRNQSAEFAAQARVKTEVVRDPKQPGVATMVTGAQDWPSPIPVVEEGGRWRFDSEAGRQEVLYRRIGENELNAIQMCRGYVEAQHEYAAQKHDGGRVNQYAQRVVSTPGRQDGLAWRTPDGTWQGPVGEAIARVIAEGYAERYEPFHGYYFRILKGQGPAAPMGQMDFVLDGVMIGGFALVAAPADYAVTGVKTFIVSHTGIVYEKDLGPETLKQFRVMDRYNPDSTWTPVSEQ